MDQQPEQDGVWTMEAIISTLATTSIVLVLFGIIWRNLTDRVKNMEDKKVDKETCQLQHKQETEKFDILFTKVDKIQNNITEILLTMKNPKGDDCNE